eukprot:767928-Pleurochrysis_carterae.AAC.1
MQFRIVFSQSQGSLRDGSKAGALAASKPLEGKPKTVKRPFMYRSKQGSIASEESTLKMREKCLSYGGLDSRKISLGLSTFWLVILFVAPGGENSPARRPCGAIRKQTR